MYKITLSIVVACTLFCNSCTKDADVKLPKVESKLVINSFISPQDTIIKVEVSLSQPLYNNSNSAQYFDVSDATVQINDGSNTQTLVYNSNENYYSLNAALFPIVVGTTYYLTVSTPDGKNIQAITSIPAINSTLTYTSQNANDPNDPDKYNIKTAFNDSPGTENYYRISYYEKSFYNGNPDTTYYLNFSDNFSDKNNDGNTFYKNIEVYKMNSTGSAGELYLIHASMEYYLFHSKLEDAANSGNPFSEPVQMYSNVNEGYGVFAGFNQYKLQVFL